MARNFMNTRQAAKALGRSMTFVHALAHSGAIDAKMVNGKWRIYDLGPYGGAAPEDHQETHGDGKHVPLSVFRMAVPARRHTIEEWCRTGVIPAILDGREWRILATAVPRERLMTLHVAAKRLRAYESDVEKMAQAGEIGSAVFGKDRYIIASDVDRILHGEKSQEPAPAVLSSPSLSEGQLIDAIRAMAHRSPLLAAAVRSIDLEVEKDRGEIFLGVADAREHEAIQSVPPFVERSIIDGMIDSIHSHHVRSLGPSYGRSLRIARDAAGLAITDLSMRSMTKAQAILDAEAGGYMDYSAHHRVASALRRSMPAHETTP